VISEAGYGHESGCGHDDGSAPRRVRGHVFWPLGRAARTAQQLAQASLAAAGMHRGYYGVLAALEEFGPSAQADLGRRLGLDPSDMVAILNDLEHQQWVRREPDPADRRRNKVTLTPAGQAALVQADQAVTDAEDELLARLGPADRSALAALLARLTPGEAG
jgi:MarR family transcriptional regulator, lower aerobic nicotinate degradation pathway regulator